MSSVAYRNGEYNADKTTYAIFKRPYWANGVPMQPGYTFVAWSQHTGSPGAALERCNHYSEGDWLVQVFQRGKTVGGQQVWPFTVRPPEKQALEVVPT